MPNAGEIGRGTEFSNDHYTGAVWGPSTDDCDYIELFVAPCPAAPGATEVDIRGWIIDDNAGNFNTEGGCTTGVGISSGHLRFADVPAWASVPVGTVIVLYNGDDNCYGFTVDESGTGPYFIEVGSSALIERTTTRPTPTDCDYCDAAYAAPGSSPWNTVALGNSADAIQVRCPDCPGSEAGFFHGLGYGSGFNGITAGTNDLGGAYVSGPGGGRTYELTGPGAPGNGTNWTRISAPAGGTPPATAGVVDASVVAWLEGASLACCGSFEAPVLAQKQGYRFGFNGQEKDNEIYGSEGTSYTAEFWQYDPRVARRWNLDPVDKPWITRYHAFSNRPITNIDPNGANDDWVQGADGAIKWDDAANSQETTKAGETYLGKTLNFEFKSTITDSYDGPRPPWDVTGDKLVSRITLSSTEDENGGLISVNVTSTPDVKATGGLSIFKGRDYFPGLPSTQNREMQVTNAREFYGEFEQHASVPGVEAFGLNLLGYDVVNVAQRMTLSLSGNQLSITASTDVFPSATLSVNNIQLFSYAQPSFVGTHGRNRSFEDNGTGGVGLISTSRRPPPNFHLRYSK